MRTPKKSTANKLITRFDKELVAILMSDLKAKNAQKQGKIIANL